ncbi:MAG: molybdopterin-synthase adenylyltransferase MoeB [Deltaproteobacteria bacterium]|nr:molybdopterin-synthase adenylyltransferase MoeB [Deltaproteobacteria bacterium]MCL5893002.1 molybdopterin-synthase adenylyltransferase MoeB [Deltaproteobacteria bacterium]
MEFTEEQIKRYARHIILPEVGGEGQIKLLSSKVLLIGAGGLGAPCGYYLGAAGIGTLGIVDFDTVDLSNLQRQIWHGTADVGRYKVDSAKDSIARINPDVNVVTYKEKISSENIKGLIKDYDVIIDATDNFPTRYLINDACHFMRKPLVYGSIFRFDGQATVFLPEEGPCYRCLFPSPPPPGLVPSCQEAGVLGVLPGVVGAIQANEAIKIILGVGQTLNGRLLIYDALDMKFTEMKLRQDRTCPLCGESPSVFDLIDYEDFCEFRKEN